MQQISQVRSRPEHRLTMPALAKIDVTKQCAERRTESSCCITLRPGNHSTGESAKGGEDYGSQRQRYIRRGCGRVVDRAQRFLMKRTAELCPEGVVSVVRY